MRGGTRNEPYVCRLYSILLQTIQQVWIKVNEEYHLSVASSAYPTNPQRARTQG